MKVRSENPMYENNYVSVSILLDGSLTAEVKMAHGTRSTRNESPFCVVHGLSVMKKKWVMLGLFLPPSDWRTSHKLCAARPDRRSLHCEVRDLGTLVRVRLEQLTQSVAISPELKWATHNMTQYAFWGSIQPILALWKTFMSNSYSF